ncbi:hypothetical protein ONS95_013368 [Cadophora gregata]|uniref:uncharacterized protein n=1 Tax=Cadophora gregata TaxID=51156 RepID=UPI0026DDA118|nr:uncharacterized protein ONS95_013368 [Cadophora gregata]KAK0099738.1 hypothetical protein ONS96_008235 [Cadophora gregata f. sp. sojae]KAK0116347.1 hypothetical protein ONS95_013368 [Cadophora gregata]
MSLKPSLYQSLDPESRTIRLLHIFRSPHPTDGRLQCSLVTHSLNSSIKYQALSYTWGQPDNFDFQIWINGILVPVRRNLLCALRARRANYKSEDERAFAVGKASDVGSLIWVDALCIDQSNIVERGHQVDMMGDIFREAEEVLAWLGTPDELELSDPRLDVRAESPEVIEVPAFNLATRAMHIKRVLGLVIQGQENGGVSVDDVDTSLIWDKSWGPKAHEKKEWREDIIKDEENGHELVQLEELCHVEYWSRLWIMQEVCLARRLLLLYGRHTMNWSSLSDFHQAISRSTIPWKLDDFPPVMSQILNSRPWKILQVTKDGMKPHIPHLWTKSEWFLGTTLENALRLSRDAFCHERKDKVFGILGLADDVDTGDIVVDYSISLFELYSNVLLFHRRRLSEEHSEEYLRIGPDRAYISERIVLTGLIEFSKLLQNALFGPDFKKEAYREIKLARENVSEPNGWGPQETIPLSGDVVDGVVATCHEDELIASFFKENPAASRQYSGTADSIVTELKRTWDCNKFAFEFLIGPRSDETMDAEHCLALFSTEQQFLGIAPRGIRAGDLLWEYTLDNTFLMVIRHVGQTYQPVGRACVLTDWEEAFVFHEGRLEVRKQPEDSINIPVGIHELQVLTSPLRQQLLGGVELSDGGSVSYL